MKRRSLGNWGRITSTLLVSVGLGVALASACTPVTRDFDSGPGGAGGSSQVCVPDTSEPCYTGPAGTEDFGACKRGTHVCLPSGNGFGECAGEVVPTTEICSTPIDEACDGPNPVECPPLAHVWSKNYGGLGEDAVTSIALDPVSGDIFVTGYFNQTIDFGGNPMASTGNTDIFLARLTADGQHVWSKRFGDAEGQTPTGIALDSKGNVYIVGEMTGSIDFGDGKPVTSKGGFDAFVAKFDPNGTFIWSRLFGDSMSQRAKSVAITPTNQVIVAGNFDGLIPLTGMELPSNMNSTDMFVIKLDESGFDITAKRYGSPASEELMDVAVDSKGGVLLAGSYGDLIDFGQLGGFPSAGGDDAFVLKLLPDFTEEYVRVYQDVGQQRADTVVTTPTDEIFLAGSFEGTILLGDGSSLTAPAQERGMFLVSLNAQGSIVWGKSPVSTMTSFVQTQLAVDPASKTLVAVGYYNGSLDFGGGPLVSDLIDAFVAKAGWDGSPIASKRLGGPGVDAFFQSAISPAGDIFICGGHLGPADFGGGVLPTPDPQDVQALLVRLLP